MFYYWSLMDSRCIFMAYGVFLKHLEVDKITCVGNTDLYQLGTPFITP
jgi:hypothetical protein